jgi:hypothetical protein
MELPKLLKDEIWDYCRVNNITNIDDFTLKLVKQGFTVEKYGATPEVKTVEKIVEKIVEVPVTLENNEVSESLTKYMGLYDQSQADNKKLADQILDLSKQLEAEEKRNKKDLYGEQ